MKSVNLALISCGLLAWAAGCGSVTPKAEFDFDKDGWGGPDLEYQQNPVAKEVVIRRGMLVSKEFRWAESEFAFEFKDSPDLVWGIRLLDSVFRASRRRVLRQERTLIKTGPGKFYSGKALPPDQVWRLWTYDRVLDVAMDRDRKRRGYKVFGGWWYERLLGDGLTAVKSEGAHDLRIKRNAWNTFSAKVSRGKFTYKLNGEPGLGTFQVDPRTNGRLGIFVERGAPLRIRNVKLSRAEE